MSFPVQITWNDWVGIDYAGEHSLNLLFSLRTAAKLYSFSFTLPSLIIVLSCVVAAV